jgi:transposase
MEPVTTPRAGRRRGPLLAPLVLAAQEQATLQRWAERPSSAQALALRCRIVLACAEGTSNSQVARQLGVARSTVIKWRARFVAHRLDGLVDEPRPGAPRTISDEQVERVLVMTLETTPTDATHWSTRSLARKLGMSQSAISRIWRAFGLKPHLVDTFKLSTDPQFIDKIRDIAGLYLNPPQAALVLCVDEKTQVQALDRTAPILPLLPGTPQRATHDYTRHGVTNLYAALDVASGKVISQLTARHRAIEFKRFLDQVEGQVPAGLAVHVVCDNSSTHKTPAIQRWLLRHPRFQLHFTPTYSSWLNLVERWFAELTTKWLRRAPTVRWPNSSDRSSPGSTPGTMTRARLCGPRPPTRSSTPSPPTASESTTQHTRPSTSTAAPGSCTSLHARDPGRQWLQPVGATPAAASPYWGSPSAGRSARRLIAASQLRRMAPLAGRISHQ